MTTYPTLTKEEFAHFLECDREFVKRYNLLIPLTRRVRRGLQNLFIAKYYGLFGFERNQGDALMHYDKACVYDSSVRDMEKTKLVVEEIRAQLSLSA